jgi:hypothetical protein
MSIVDCEGIGEKLIAEADWLTAKRNHIQSAKSISKKQTIPQVLS